MPYTTPERIEKLLREFVDLEKYQPEDMELFIQKAEARINDRLRPYYRVPFADPVPDIIVSIAEDFACSFLVDQDYVDRPNSEQVPLAQVFFERAEKDLERVAANLTLHGLPGVVPVAQPTGMRGPMVATNTPNRSPMKAVLDRWPV
ncbi:hypothetical protein [Paenibacillus naphthalenovorans]|uniref:hypothetical protein n=1 Tax=Paenibacillus naphthalenovorans TaxID=162209 RepID=UPI003D2B5C23